MPGNPENQYIRNIDRSRLPPSLMINESLAKSAEKVVVDYFNQNFNGKGMRARLATPIEDSGIKREGGKQIDAVVYYAEKPVMCIQITTARDPSVREQKIRQLAENPFLRLEEMRREDMSIPKVVVGLNHEEVESFLSNPDFSKYPKISKKIMSDITKSLLFVLNITKNEKEKKEVKELLLVLESGQNILH